LNVRKIAGKSFAAAFWFALSALLLFSFAVPAPAQTDASAATLPQEDTAAPAQETDTPRNRGGLLSHLNLSPDQRAQIRAIRQQTDGEGRLLMQRIRQARRALDEAIYSGNADEAVVEERVRELVAAQAAAVRLRAFTEMKLRRVLTPEQLSVLRDLRQQALTRRMRRQQEDADPQMRLRKRLNNRLHQRPNRPDR
jgi:Spy/CpxP family protein refolding chaperone